MAKRKAARQRSQSTVCLERGKSEQEAQAGQGPRNSEDASEHGRALSLSNQQLRRSMGHISAYNGNNKKNNADYQQHGIRQGSVSSDINQLPMIANQSAIIQYNAVAVNGNSMEREYRQDDDDVVYASNKDSLYASGGFPSRENNGWHQQSAFQLAAGQMHQQQQHRYEQSVDDSPRRPSLTWHERKNWPSKKQSENLINRSMQSHQLQQQQPQLEQLPQESLELKLPGIWKNSNVDFGNEVTWGNAREKSLPLSHLELLHDPSTLDNGNERYLASAGSALAAAEAFNCDVDEAEKLRRQPQSMQGER